MTGFNTDLNNTLPDQRVSFKTKQSAKWSKNMADYVVGLAISCNDKVRTANFMNMANGHIDKAMYEYALKSYGGKDNDKENILKDLREIDWLQPIKDKYLGEFVSSYNIRHIDIKNYIRIHAIMLNVSALYFFLLVLLLNE